MAVVYARLNGYLDDIATDKVNVFCTGLREYLKPSKHIYAKNVSDEKQLKDEAEGLLKDGINEYKQAFK